MGKMIGTIEAAQRLGVTRARVHALCKQRRIPGTRLVAGRAWLLPEDFEVTPGTRGPKLRRSSPETGKMSQARNKRERFFADHPTCCFCGGETPATTVDHIPSRNHFSERIAP